MSVDPILTATRAQFPDWCDDRLEIMPLEKGGSDRKFYRLRSAARSMIFIQYTVSREENAHYVEIANFLSANQLRAPVVYHHDTDQKIIWMQDLGEKDLWQLRTEPWAIRRPNYASALEQTVALQMNATPAVTKSLNLQPAFDETLYRWEQTYFFENCLGVALGKNPEEVVRHQTNAVFETIIRRLAELPRSLVHRDFQSQNLMIHDEQVWLIDFQGMRLGRPEYDLASLLYDPYVALTEAERDDALADYAQLLQDKGGALPANFREIFDLCALQRLMQALGAYGFLGYHKGKPHFLNHIPAAKKSLIEVASRIAGLDAFVAMLKES